VSARAKPSPQADEFRVALDNRAFEIQLFWQRSNYFLVLMSALGIGTFSVKSILISPIISMFAVICSYFWFQTNLGSKFWQEFWEAEVQLLAPNVGAKAFEKTTSEAVDQVRYSLNFGIISNDRRVLRGWIHRKIIEKPSVTYNIILLSLWATVVWAMVSFVLLWRAVPLYIFYVEMWCSWAGNHIMLLYIWISNYRSS
jgi:hypothetical protein